MCTAETTVEINVIIDEFVIMPNHLHIIIIINNKKYEQCAVETDCNLSLQK